MTDPTSALVLYTTEGCHLCEQAEDILFSIGARFEPVDIAEEHQLIERYGVRIPVLARADGRELGWPFDATAVRAWLAS